MVSRLEKLEKHKAMSPTSSQAVLKSMCYGTAKDSVCKERNGLPLSTAAGVRGGTVTDVWGDEADAVGRWCSRSPVWTKGSQGTMKGEGRMETSESLLEGSISPLPWLSVVEHVCLLAPLPSAFTHDQHVRNLSSPVVAHSQPSRWTSVSHWDGNFKRSNYKLTFMWLSLGKRLANLSLLN